jgi:hypothetical protein
LHKEGDERILCGSKPKDRRLITMVEYSVGEGIGHFSSRSGLAAVGVLVQELDLLAPIREGVHIAQKSVKYTPYEKLVDVVIGLLAGAHGLVELNTRVRPDRGLQRAFGRTGCAEQSVVQATLNACTAETVQQMEAALAQIVRQHSGAAQHDFAADWLLLDVDLTGLPCGPKAELATKGYFAQARYRRGRQMGRVLATAYQEVLVDQLYDGKQSLSRAFAPLVTQAGEVLELDAAQRARTIVRMDAGGGSVADITWALAQGYQVHGKDYCGTRTRRLAEGVMQWVADPQVAGREVGWVREASTALYGQELVRVAVRCRKANQQWAYGVIVSTLTPATVRTLLRSERALPAAEGDLLAYVYFYDQRGGGVETAIKEDKQGLGLTTRNKKRFAAQQMLMLLGTLAHNLLIWVRRWLAAQVPRLATFGLMRWVRDLLTLPGFLAWQPDGPLQRICFNQCAPLAAELAAALTALPTLQHLSFILGET